MGSGLIEAEAAGCTGDDVLHGLDEVFGHPNSKKYRDAKNVALDLFEGVPYGPNNWPDLYAAYEAAYQAAGVSVCQNWKDYLRTLSPEDIYTIAQARAQGLVMGLAMTTIVHDPKQGGHGVNVSNGGGSMTIDSPYTAGVVYRNRSRKP